MFSQELDVILAVIFGILMVVFFMGKGEAIIDLFGPKNNPNKKKRTKEEERIYQRYMGFFMLPLFITEIFAILFPVPVMGLVLAGVAAADLVVFAILTKGK
ncbi:MAG: hypothetical protein IKE31_01335 [Eubacterium sp.]|nr:hypothetical protein [Eubacterium sp.]